MFKLGDIVEGVKFETLAYNGKRAKVTKGEFIEKGTSYIHVEFNGEKGSACYYTWRFKKVNTEKINLL